MNLTSSSSLKVSNTMKVLRNRTVLIAIGGAVLVVLIWFVAFFSPQGKDLSKYNAEEQQLQVQQASLQAQLAQLRATSKATPQLLALQSQYANLIPPTTDIYNYITTLSSTATATGVHVVSITPTTTGSLVPGANVSAIPVSLATTGTYDATLAFIKAVYSLPRLTVIDSLTLSGGGPGTNRSAMLAENFSLTIYTTAKPTSPTS